MDYPTYIANLATILVITPDDPKFTSVLPRLIEYAELRIIRDLDFLQTVGSEAVDMTAGNRIVTLPSDFVVVETANIITPAVTDPDDGERVPLERVTVDFLNFVWPGADTGIPQYFAMLSQWTALVGPRPDDAYKFEAVGTKRPEPLSESNPSTFISENLPDLFMAASLVWGFGYQRNFGAQASDPGTAQSWENTYKTLLTSSQVEEARKKSASLGWSAKQPEPVATPPRS